MTSGETGNPPFNILAFRRQAIDRACEDDRAWFTKHTGRQYRLRDAVPHEFNDWVDQRPTGDLTPRVLVTAIPGIGRARVPLLLLASIPNDLDDDTLAKIAAEAIPPGALPDGIE